MTTEPISPERLDSVAIMAEHEDHWQAGYVCLGGRQYAHGSGRDWHGDRHHCLPYRLAATLADRDAKIVAVRALHYEAEDVLEDEAERFLGYCHHDGEMWPCPTIRALGEESGRHPNAEPGLIEELDETFRSVEAGERGEP